MLKLLAFTSIVVLGFAIFVAVQDERAAQHHADQSANALEQSEATLIPKTNKERSNNDVYNPEWDTPRWYGVFRWPGGVTTWAILLSLGALIEQTRHTAKAADAALLNAQAIINAERAWIAVSIQDEFAPVPEGRGIHARRSAVKENNRRAISRFLANQSDDPRTFFVTCANKGRTPAKIIGGDITHCFIDDPENLPVPPTYSGAFIMPHDTFVLNARRFEIKPGFSPRSIWDQARLRGSLRANDKFLIIYGRVIYEDVFAFGKQHKRVRHETRWCYACMAEAEQELVSCGPAAYNQYT